VSYDAIIIGAGLSGLAAGIRLAYFDKSVCILERHTTIGGLNSFYRLRGRNHDVGLHAMTNYAAPGTRTGPLSKLLRQLRLRWEDFSLSPQIESRVVFPGRTLRFNNEFAFFEQQVADQFPQQIDNFRRLTQRIDAFDELNLDQNEKALTARQVLGEHLGDPLLIDMLLCPLMFYGSATARDMDFNQFVIMFKSIFREGFARPIQGVRLILKNVVRKYKSLGGELRLRAGVKRIVTDGQHATGVVLEDGTELQAKQILTSAGYVETMRLLDITPTEGMVPQEALQPGDVTFVETISVLDRMPADLGHSDTIVFYNDCPDFHYENPAEPCDIRSGIICSPNNFQYPQPLADGSIRITALANNRYWMHLSEDAYVAEKRRWYDRMVESAIRFMPDFRPHVIETDVFTPRTIHKFTGHVNGCVYGAPKKHLSGRTHLDNLFICGTDQGFLGIVGSMLSGISMANLHVLKQS
jgi:phytoene dehydrogenase-like protein